MTAAEITLSLADWYKALAACSRNQSYSIEGRSLTRADLAEVRKTIDWLETKRATLLSQPANGGRGRVSYVG